MKAFIGAAVLALSLGAADALADTQVPLSAARFDGANLFGQYRAPVAPSRLFSPVSPVPPNPTTTKCGMKMIPGDRKIDPGIVTPKMLNPTRFKIRTVDPPLCR